MRNQILHSNQLYFSALAIKPFLKAVQRCHNFLRNTTDHSSIKYFTTRTTHRPLLMCSVLSVLDGR